MEFHFLYDLTASSEYTSVNCTEYNKLHTLSALRQQD